jgi:hypothetical protein
MQAIPEFTTDICYVISHGFAARMLLQTGLIRQLAGQGKTIAIVAPDAGDENLQALALEENISIYESEMNLSLWDDDYNFKRVYYLEDLRSNPVFWEKHIYSIRYSKSKHPWKRVRPFYYYAIHQLIRIFPGIRERFKRTEDRHLVSGKANELIRKINPRLLVSTYPVNFLEAKMLYAARQHGVPTMLHLLSWDNITSKGIFPVVADFFVAWGRVMYEELKQYYSLPDDRIFVSGVPHFDHHIRVKEQPAFQLILRDLGLDPAKPYLLLAMSSPRFAPKEIDIVEWLAQRISAGHLGDDLQLIVRPHPQNMQGSMSDRSWLKRLDRIRNDRVAVDYPRLIDSKLRWSMKKEDMDHLSNLLSGCAICINSGSTVSIDALQFDKPVLLTAFDGDRMLTYWKSARRLIDYPHQKKFIALGGAKVVQSYPELTDSIQQYLADPELDQAQRRNALLSECFKNDGQSTQRVIHVMNQLLERLKNESVIKNDNR